MNLEILHLQSCRNGPDYMAVTTIEHSQDLFTKI